MHVDLVLVAHLGTQVGLKVRGSKEGFEFVSLLKGNFMTLRHHAEESVHSLGDLIFWSRDGHNVACLFCARKVNFAIPLLLEVLDLGKPGNELAVVQTIDDDCLRDKLSILETVR